MHVRRVTAVLAWAVGPVLIGAASPVWAHDVDGDGDADLNDFNILAGCLTGPSAGYPTDCDAADLNGDGHVDLADFALFQRGFTGPLPVVIETVIVGNPGNPGELSGAGAGGYGPDRICGAVDYVYNIGRHEVTAGQYCEFLNAVAATDTYGLYHSIMNLSSYGCQITRNGTDGNYTYDFSGRTSGTEADWVNRPVNYISWGDAARFANWLHNGQPMGDQDLTTTEDGSYYLDGATSDAELSAITREPDATWVIPSEDEWYKAAYHHNDGVTCNYYAFPTSSDGGPVNELIDPDPGNNATFFDGDGLTIGLPYYRTGSGAHENSDSPYGTFDQGGNVYEWNEAIMPGSYRGLRGGSFFVGAGYLRASYRNSSSPTNEFNTFGFRVVELP